MCTDEMVDQPDLMKLRVAKGRFVEHTYRKGETAFEEAIRCRLSLLAVMILAG